MQTTRKHNWRNTIINTKLNAYVLYNTNDISQELFYIRINIFKYGRRRVAAFGSVATRHCKILRNWNLTQRKKKRHFNSECNHRTYIYACTVANSMSWLFCVEKTIVTEMCALCDLDPCGIRYTAICELIVSNKRIQSPFDLFFILYFRPLRGENRRQDMTGYSNRVKV